MYESVYVGLALPLAGGYRLEDGVGEAAALTPKSEACIGRKLLVKHLAKQQEPRAFQALQVHMAQASAEFFVEHLAPFASKELTVFTQVSCKAAKTVCFRQVSTSPVSSE